MDPYWIVHLFKISYSFLLAHSPLLESMCPVPLPPIILEVDNWFWFYRLITKGVCFRINCVLSLTFIWCRQDSVLCTPDCWTDAGTETLSYWNECVLDCQRDLSLWTKGRMLLFKNILQFICWSLFPKVFSWVHMLEPSFPVCRILLESQKINCEDP